MDVRPMMPQTRAPMPGFWAELGVEAVARRVYEAAVRLLENEGSMPRR